MRLAVIPARGGSKRIPRKNIRDFAGKPIIAHAIRTAFDAGCFDEVMVSTDDEEIAQIAKTVGAAVPFLRSAATSTDHSTTAEVLLEVIERYRERRVTPEYLCCIYPTTPLLSHSTVRQGFHVLREDPDIATAVTVSRFSHPVQRALVLRDSRLAFLQPEHAHSRTQDLEPTYYDAGQCYWIRVADFEVAKALFTARTAALVVPPWQAQDIDTEEDWTMAELKFHMMKAAR